MTDLEFIKQDVKYAKDTLDVSIEHLKSHDAVATGKIDSILYDLAHAYAAISIANYLINNYAGIGKNEEMLSCGFAADAIQQLVAKTFFREDRWAISMGWESKFSGAVSKFRDPSFVSDLYDIECNRNLDPEFDLVAETFRKFGEDKILPYAEIVHRNNLDVPEEIISELAQIGGFGLSIPEEFGGFATGGERDYLGMVVATEELSKASLGIGGSLITRPEILARALVAGGTAEQKTKWLPKLASGEIIAAVAVTEPDYGSDVANIAVTAKKTEGGFLVNGVKTWCTFAARADVLMLLARTDPDKSKAHRGLSLFIVEKPRADGKGFIINQDGTYGRLEGRPIDTLGYRGMHSYELSFDNWFVPDDCLVGEQAGLGKGFYFQMKGFENGRLQTAARALGVMQAAYQEALSYAKNRVVFGSPIIQYQVTKEKLGRMKILIESSRQFAYHVAHLMGEQAGSMEASLIKAYVCKAAEWVTREAMQIHGGMGYAEEFSVSRLFVDARVLSIFEGADETLALKVIARSLVGK
jgi:(2S)-methylsuccinyl-CoA dehydrogenase